MTLDEAIKHAEEKAEEQREKAKEFHQAQVNKCRILPFVEMDYTYENRCKKCAEEHEQLAEWLKELKDWRSGKRVRFANDETETLIFDFGE